MDCSARALPRAGGPLDLASLGRLLAASPRQGLGRGPEVALGAAAATPEADPDAGIEEFRDTLPSGGHAGRSAETPRSVTREAEGQHIWPREALPGHKEGRLKALPDWKPPTCAGQ